jgi:hypothetical protein
MSSLYFAYNGAMATTSPFTPVATSAVSGTAKTMLQVATTSSTAIRIVKWGVMFDGSASTAPLKCELLTTNVAATVTAHVAAGVQPYGPDQSASSVALGTAATGYTATAEGTITATRYGDLQWILPGNYFQNEWSLAREFFVPVSTFVRIRVTPTEAVARNCTCFMVWEE